MNKKMPWIVYKLHKINYVKQNSKKEVACFSNFFFFISDTSKVAWNINCFYIFEILIYLLLIKIMQIRKDIFACMNPKNQAFLDSNLFIITVRRQR